MKETEPPKPIPKDSEALLLLSRTPGIRMHGLKAFFEEKGTGPFVSCPLFFFGKKPPEILDWVSSGTNPAWKESLEATCKVFDPERGYPFEPVRFQLELARS